MPRNLNDTPDTTRNLFDLEAFRGIRTKEDSTQLAESLGIHPTLIGGNLAFMPQFSASLQEKKETIPLPATERPQEANLELEEHNRSTRQIYEMFQQMAGSFFRYLEEIQQGLGAFDKTVLRLQELMDTAQRKAGELMPQPPAPPAFTKNESLALFLTALINWRAAGVAARSLDEEKKKQYESQFEKYKVQSQLALEEYNRTMQRLGMLSNNMANAQLNLMQREQAVLQTLATLFPQLGELQRKREADYMDAVIQRHRTALAERNMRLLEKYRGQEMELKLAELQQSQNEFVFSLLREAEKMNNPFFAELALQYAQRLNPFWSDPRTNEMGQKIYAHIQERLENEKLKTAHQIAMGELTRRKLDLEVQAMGFNVYLLHKYGETLKQLEVAKLKADVDRIRSLTQNIRTRTQALAQKGIQNLSVNDIVDLQMMALQGFVISGMDDLGLPDDVRNQLRDNALMLFGATESALGQVFTQFGLPSQYMQRGQTAPNILGGGGFGVFTMPGQGGGTGTGAQTGGGGVIRPGSSGP